MQNIKDSRVLLGALACHALYLGQSLGGHDHQLIRGNADKVAILAHQGRVMIVDLRIPGGVEPIELGDLCEEWSREVGEPVEKTR